MTTKSLTALFVSVVVFLAGAIVAYMLCSCSFKNTIEKYVPNTKSRVAIASVMRHPVDLPIWLRYHRKMGIYKFFIRLEDSPSQIDYLRGYDDIWLEVGEADKVGGGNNYFTIMDRQKLFVDKCLQLSSEQGDVDFLFNIDSDELLFGGLSCLDHLSKDIKCVHIENAEAVYDGNEEDCFSSKRFRKCSLQSKCRSYINGKGGGRPDDKVTQAGPHYFAYDGAIKGRHQKLIKFEDLAVLHFDSCSFASWSSKFANLKSDPEIPFSYYDESISAASKAYEVWKKHAVVLLEDDDILTLEHFDQFIGEEDLEKDEVGLSEDELTDMEPWLKTLQAVCINLDKNKTKWLDLKNNFMKTDLANANIPLWRFNAVVGKTLDVDTVGLMSKSARDDLKITEKNGYRLHHHDLTRGGIGCFLSHWLIFEDLMNDQSNSVYLVLEDDAQLDKHIFEKLKELKLPKDWDVLLLGTARLNASSISHDILRAYGFWGTHGYLINKQGAEKCVRSFKAEPIDAQIDSRLSWLTRNPDDHSRLNVYATKIELVTINEKYKHVTDIQWPIKETPDSYYYRNVKLL